MPCIAKNKPVEKFYETLARYDTVGAVHEQAVKTAFHEVLQETARKRFTVVPEDSVLGKSIRYDGVLKDDLGIALGYWEAKDLDDDLEREIQKMIDRGYSLRNTLFQTPERALLVDATSSVCSWEAGGRFRSAGVSAASAAPNPVWCAQSP